jgi:transcriptional regulator with XRE-family HTH domain
MLNEMEDGVPKTPRLREWRDRAALSQGELGDRAGVSRATVADLEAGNRGAQPRTVRRLAEALNVEPEDLYRQAEYPKEKAPPSQEKLFNNGVLEEERRLQYLRPWRAFVHGLARRWEKEPPKTSGEIAPLYEALTAVVEQGVFEPSELVGPSEAHELMLLTLGFERLNEIANKVEQDEERNAVVRDIREKHSA